MSDASTTTVAEGGRDVGGVSGIFSSTSTAGSPELSKGDSLPSVNTEGTGSIKNVAVPASSNSPMPNLVPGLEAVLRRNLRGGPTVLSSLKTDIRTSNPACSMLLGDADFCVKPDRPDGVQDTLGLTVLDESAVLPTDDGAPLLGLRTCLPSIGDNQVEGSPSLTDRVENTQVLSRDVEAWVTSVKAHHAGLAATAKAAGLDSTSSDVFAHIQRPLGLQINCALQKQFSFCISELPMLPLSIEELARLICWLGGVPSTQSINSPLPELLALFTLCFEEVPTASDTGINKQLAIS
ncbi:uncharacterized protein EMH_0057130 [Eimeria mitis]|uniref:Uncharacterized protein n=1 Tax=Eimeria mitis TaxID=44415 RepID=U6KI48_9EIME|nr:uncharacterized protein EMH_0057130 [Eimeria mitis]CDJ36461.1 hypothetical protein EMH_0057130 [Eimeria mitis]